MKKLFLISLALILLAPAIFALGVEARYPGFGGVFWDLNPTTKVGIDLYYSSDATIGSTTSTYLQTYLWGDWTLFKVNQYISVYDGGILGFGCTGGATSTTTFNLIGLVGVDLKVMDKLSFFSDFYLVDISHTSQNGASATDVTLLVGSPIIISGARINL
ncbi:MAG: hypothetical protein WC901_03750 [Candidatus Margulisiibacteriota bacterium]